MASVRAAATFDVSQVYLMTAMSPRGKLAFWNYNVRMDLKARRGGLRMNGIIYLVGLIVIVMFILSLLGLR